MEPRLGQIVVSVAGRDRGRYYVITGIVDARHVAVADGERRRASKPKRKNVRHLMLTRRCDGGLATKLAAGMEITDAEVRAALKEYEDGNSGRADWPDE